MGLYRRGRIFWYNIMEGGKRIQRSAKTTNKKTAEQRYAKALTEIREGQWFENERARSITFEQLWIKYREKYEKQRDHYTIKHLLPYFGEMKLSEFTSELVENYILGRADDGAKPSTIYKEYALGKRMFNVARRKWKWTRDNPFSDVTFSELQTIDNERDRVVTVEEEKMLLESSRSQDMKDAIVFAIHTGCRRSEILDSSWKENIDMKGRVVRYPPQKRGNKKTIPMSDTLYEALLRRSRVKHISGEVFPVEKEALKDAFKRVVKKAGIEDLHFHDLRHTFATRLVQAGVDLYRVQKLLGHKSIKTTERYAHHCPKSLRPSVRALDDCYNFTTVGDFGTCNKTEKSNKINEGSG